MEDSFNWPLDELAQERWEWLRQQPQDAWLLFIRTANWDDSEGIFLEMLDDPNCDRAVAAWLFWLSSPDYSLELGEYRWAEVTQKVIENYDKGYYRKADIYLDRYFLARNTDPMQVVLREGNATDLFMLPRALCGPFGNRKAKIEHPGQDLLERLSFEVDQDIYLSEEEYDRYEKSGNYGHYRDFYELPPMAENFEQEHSHLSDHEYLLAAFGDPKLRSDAHSAFKAARRQSEQPIDRMKIGTSSIFQIAFWAPLVIAAALLIAYVWMHRPFAVDGTELLQVPLSEADPELNQVGDLKYLGGLDIPRMGENIGGLSGLRWDETSGRLLAITDDARWVWMTPIEEDEQLTGVAEVEVGALLGLDGEPLEGKEEGDSEALARDADGVWAVAFERDHRVLRYLDGLGAPPFEILFDPDGDLGGVEENAGMEAYAVGKAGQLMCAERATTPDLANCNFYNFSEDRHEWFSVYPPEELVELGAVPTDADALTDGTFLILFRSYSPAEGNTAAIVAYAPGGTRREIATFLPPLTLDNFEGLAVREEGEGDAKRTFLYTVSDDNFSGSQRTLLMKFEMMAEE